ncbi:MAG: transglutaminase-like cysteine peptidase [Burkholderiales bacterium]|nr:transglutaminase-like cysteine peptidase [Burkholderiales bacterium]
MCLALFAFGFNPARAATHELGFSRSVTQGLVEYFSARFGEGSRRRIGDWQGFVRSVPAEQRAGSNLEQVRLVRAIATEQRQRSGNDLELLSSVNSFFNDVSYVSDRTQWGTDDYWASPAEMLASNGADCEDFSIAKYFALKELGVPIERLRITYVKAVRLNQAHMVLAYYPSPTGEPLILDNLEHWVRPASERTDLVPVYSFNDEDVLLARQGRPDTRAGSSSQIRLWRALLDKLEKELQY